MSIYSSMYYEPNFELGEDIRTEERARQDDEWKNAVQDGRAHVSHREATATHAERLAYSIYTHHQVEAIVDCITGVVGKKNHLYGLDKYMGFTIVEFLHGVGHGFLLTAAVARRLVKPSPPSRPTDAMAFRLCVRKRPLLSFEVLEGSRHSQPYTAEEAAGVSRIPYDACCATLQPLGQCVCLHDGKLARNGRRLSMQHHVTFADRVWCEREENAAFCTAELLPLLAHVAPATAATAAATAVAAGAGASATAGGDGRRATLICFGQTGTGKTFTLNACLQYLARALMGGRGSSATTATAGTDSPAVLAAYEGCTVHIKFFEVHGKKCYDLLDARKEVKLLADGADVMHLRGAKSHQLDSSEGGAGAAEARVAHMLQCLQGALALRSAQVTERNPVSSRSHAVCELTVHFACDAASAAANAAQSREVAPRRTGTIRLVDLAGSERNYETLKMSAKDHAESADINTALMALKDCFRASAAQAKGCGLTVSASAEYRKGNAKKAVSSYEGHCGSSRTKGGGETEAAERKAGMQQQKAKVVRKSPSDRAAASSSATTAAGSVHIPFRAHILTRVLKDCFVAPASESRTTVVATVSPSPIDLVHSLNTLEHAVLMCPKLEQFKTSITVDISVVGALRTQEPMEKWTAVQVQAWLATADNGRFSMLTVPKELDGKGLCSLNSSSLSALFEGTLRQARIGGEGNAWVVGNDTENPSPASLAVDAPAAGPGTGTEYTEERFGVDMGFVSMDESSQGVVSAGGGTSVTNTIHGTIATNTIARALWSAIRREQASIALKKKRK